MQRYISEKKIRNENKILQIIFYKPTEMKNREIEEPNRKNKHNMNNKMIKLNPAISIMLNTTCHTYKDKFFRE